MGNFREDLEFGKIGENKTVKYLKSQDWIYEIEDVREDKFWQKHDVDFKITDIYSNIFKIEVKTDRQAHISKNVVFEVTSNKKYGTQGCFIKCKAEVMFYYFSEVDELYYIYVNMLKDYVEENKNNLRLVSMGDNALGYLLRMNKLLEKEIMFKVE